MTTITPEVSTQKQLSAIKDRAMAIWGDKWLASLTRGFEKAVGAKPRTRATMVSRWFKSDTSPTLDSFNALLMAIECEMAINYPSVEQIL